MTRTSLLLGTALSLLTLTTTLPTLAQSAPAAPDRMARAHKTPAEQAAAMTKRHTRQLGLSPDQQTTVAALNSQLSTDLNALLQTDKADKAARAARRAKAQEIKAAYDANMKATLSPEQYATYEKLRDEREQKARARHESRRAMRGKGGTRKQVPSAAPQQMTPAQG